MVADSKFLKKSQHEKELVEAFLHEWAEFPDAITLAQESVWECCQEIACKMDSKSAILCILKDGNDGMCSDARLAARDYSTVVTCDDIVRLLQFPWVYPLCIERDVCSALSLCGVERCRFQLTCDPQPPAPGFPSEELSELVRVLRKEVDRCLLYTSPSPRD